MTLTVNRLDIDGLLEIVPKVFADDRGFFSEVFHAETFREAGIEADWMQENHSLSKAAGVVRGMHYQLQPFAQDKLVRVTRGRIFDVAVDIRRGSPTFGQWASFEISAQKWNQIFVPTGFAHGFMTLEEDTEVIYKVSARYSPDHERAFRYDDPALGINWPEIGVKLQLSGKDDAAPRFQDADIGS